MPAGSAPDPGDELGEDEWLAEVVVCAELQPVNPVLDLGGGGEHEDPGAGAGEGPTHLVTVHDRQVAVEHDDVICRLRGRLEGGRAVVHRVHGHPRLTQSLSDPAASVAWSSTTNTRIRRSMRRSVTSVRHRR